ncbi:MAG: AraC family transcriptional regulator [Clostridia bacterium]|nr:AraC family transcriptional regulator [Clostridia bacterium]MDE7328574.1 AraC family transcriptional regulator [Clostridia bacterium]
MNDTFSTILNMHEADDSKQANEEALITASIKKEFVNSKEILDTAKLLSISIKDFTSGKIADFPITPIRQCDKFYIKKHTESQMPYFHSHKFYELIYVHRGKCLQRFEDGSQICLNEGQCLLLCPNAVHKIEKSKRSDIILKLVIPCDIFEKTGDKILGGRLCEKTTLFTNTSETAEFSILKLLETQSSNAEFKDLIVQSYLTIIFAELVDSQKSDIALESAINGYFESNFKTASLSEFAALQKYNANYASRLIKNRTGKSFSELLRLFRINRAKQLLTESALTVEDVAVEVGYSNTSGFYKQFFSMVGMKPSAYRNILK